MASPLDTAEGEAGFHIGKNISRPRHRRCARAAAHDLSATLTIRNQRLGAICCSCSRPLREGFRMIPSRRLAMTAVRVNLGAIDLNLMQCCGTSHPKEPGSVRIPASFSRWVRRRFFITRSMWAGAPTHPEVTAPLGALGQIMFPQRPTETMIVRTTRRRYRRAAPRPPAARAKSTILRMMKGGPILHWKLFSEMCRRR